MTDVDLVLKVGVCSICGPTKIVLKRSGKYSCAEVARRARRRYRKSSKVYKEAEKRRRRKKYLVLKEAGIPVGNNRKYRKHVKPVCESCGYEAKHPALIDGHHKDGDRKNNSPDNIKSLCPICHRIEHLPIEERVGLFGAARIPVSEAPKLCVIKVAADVDKRRELEVEALREKIKEYEMMLNGS